MIQQTQVNPSKHFLLMCITFLFAFFVYYYFRKTMSRIAQTQLSRKFIKNPNSNVWALQNKLNCECSRHWFDCTVLVKSKANHEFLASVWTLIIFLRYRPWLITELYITSWDELFIAAFTIFKKITS